VKRAIAMNQTNIALQKCAKPVETVQGEAKLSENDSEQELIVISNIRSDVKLLERAVNKSEGELVDRSKLQVGSPIWTGDDPEQVGVWMRVDRVLGVNLEKSVIELRIWLSLVWRDKKVCKQYGAVGFKESKEKKKLITVNLSKEKLHEILSLPVVFFPNIVGTFEILQEYGQLASDYVGENTVYWTRLIVGRFCDPVSAQNFPFDYEDFIVDLRLLKDRNRYFCLFRPRMYLTNHRKRVPEGVAENANSYICPINSNIPEWTICSFMNNMDQWSNKFGNQELIRLPSKVIERRGRNSVFCAYIVLKRSSRYWIQNIWCLFVISSYFPLVSFALHPSEFLNDRLNFAAGILIVQVGLKFTVAETLPRLSYLTTLDWHMYVSMLIVMGQAIVQAVSQAIQPVDGVPLQTLDTYLFYIWTFFVTLIHLAMYGYAKYNQKLDRCRMEERALLFTQFPEKEERFVLASAKVDLDKAFLNKYESYK